MMQEFYYYYFFIIILGIIVYGLSNVLRQGIKPLNSFTGDYAGSAVASLGYWEGYILIFST